MNAPTVPSEVVQERCRALVQHLEEFPDTFMMASFMRRHAIDAEHPCGTVGCLAGTLVYLDEGPLSGKVAHAEWDPAEQDDKTDGDSIAARAMNLLEIDPGAACKLWYVSEWPEPFRSRHTDEYDNPNVYKFTAQDGIDRITHFMATGE